MTTQSASEAANDLSRAADAVRSLPAITDLDSLSKRHRPRTLTNVNDSSARACLPKSMIVDGGMEIEGNYQPLVYTGGAPLLITPEQPCIILRQHPAQSTNNE